MQQPCIGWHKALDNCLERNCTFIEQWDVDATQLKQFYFV